MSRYDVLSVLVLGVILTGSCRADDPLRDKLAEIAKQIDGVRKQQKQPDIAIGEFPGQTTNLTSSGPLVEDIIREALERLGTKVKRQAALRIEGKYRDILDEVTRELQIRIDIDVVKSNGDSIGGMPLRVVVKDNRAVARLLAPTVHLDPRIDANVTNQLLRRAIATPTVFLDGSRVQSKADSPFGVEVLVLPRSDAVYLAQPLEKLLAQAEARRAAEQDGLAFVPLKLGECYMLRIHNGADHEAAVSITIDGLDLFRFAEEKNPLTGKPFGHTFVRKGDSEVIPGWFRTLKRSDAFLTTAYGRGAASLLLRGSPKIGTIAVTFAASWEGDADKPVDEGSKGGLETAIGPPVKAESQAVVRKLGQPRDIISIRYTK